jgi:hypothetical protein
VFAPTMGLVAKLTRLLPLLVGWMYPAHGTLDFGLASRKGLQGRSEVNG